MYIMVPEPISTAYFIIPSHESVYICVSRTVAKQRLAKNVTAAMSTHKTKEELLEASFYMWSVLYQWKVGD
jgi:hypothetical protein